MPIEYRERITRQMLRDEPNTLFVFGDNIARAGYGGQAREMRGEPNAVGIPTKHLPSLHPTAFFKDQDLDNQLVKGVIDKALLQLKVHLQQGGKVVIPSAGIGTGLSKLAKKAPRIEAYLDGAFQGLEYTAKYYKSKALANPSHH